MRAPKAAAALNGRGFGRTDSQKRRDTGGWKNDRKSSGAHRARHRHAGNSGFSRADPASERLEGFGFPLARRLLGRSRHGAAARHRRCHAAHQSSRDRAGWVATRAFRSALAPPGHRGDPRAGRKRARLCAAARAADRGLLERRARHDLLGHRHASRLRPVAERHGRPARARQGFQPRGPGGAGLSQQAGIVAAHGFVRPGRAFVPAQRSGGGGVSRLTSAISVHNALLAEYPDVLPPLYRGYVRHRRGEEQPGELPYTPYRVPVYSNINGKVSARYVRSYLEAGEAAAGRPMGPAELAVIDTFEAVTKRPELMLEFMLQPGDAYFINNYTILHARTAFEDGDAPEDARR